jgi:RPA family protein
MEQRQIVRQPSELMLASEFGSSHLHEKGPGEYDPTFVITKLGCKVNRIVVAGLLERLEVRETSNGTQMYQGQIRDPTGLFYFSIGEYSSLSLQELIHQLHERVSSSEPILVGLIAKTRWYQSEDGGVYTSLRPEEMTEITRQKYANWLLDAAESTYNRIQYWSSSLEVEATLEGFSKTDIPQRLHQSMVAARHHYGEVDLEVFKLNVMQALDIAEGKIEAATTPPPEIRLPIHEEIDSGDQSVGDLIKTVISHFDQGEGVQYQTIMSNTMSKGFDRETTEEAIDHLIQNGVIEEPRFGWFIMIHGQ